MSEDISEVEDNYQIFSIDQSGHKFETDNRASQASNTESKFTKLSRKQNNTSKSIVNESDFIYTTLEKSDIVTIISDPEMAKVKITKKGEEQDNPGKQIEKESYPYSLTTGLIPSTENVKMQVTKLNEVPEDSKESTQNKIDSLTLTSEAGIFNPDSEMAKIQVSKLRQEHDNRMGHESDSIPLDFAIATRVTENSDKEDILCDLCKQDNERKSAKYFCFTCNEYLCTSCYKAHRRSKYSMKHDFAHGDEMPERHFSFLDYRCPEHPDEEVEYHCITHDELFCSVCRSYNQHDRCSVCHLDESTTTADYLQEAFELVDHLNREVSSIEEIKMKGGFLPNESGDVGTEDEQINGIISQLSLFFDVVGTSSTDKGEEERNKSDIQENCLKIKRELENWCKVKNLLMKRKRSRQIILFGKYLQPKIAAYQDFLNTAKNGDDFKPRPPTQDVFSKMTIESLQNVAKAIDFILQKREQFASEIETPESGEDPMLYLKEMGINRRHITLQYRTEQPFPEVWIGKFHSAFDVLVEKHPKDSMTKDAILDEAVLMKSLEHENIAKLIGVCLKDSPFDILIITQQLLHGSLLIYMQFDSGRRLSFNEQLFILAQTADGMSYLASRRIIHRYLKASNIQVGQENRIKIGGFSLACTVNKSSQILYENVTPSTLSHLQLSVIEKWTAPEAIQNKEWSVKSDVWSFGILMYEVITRGKEPYFGMDDGRNLQHKINDGYRLPKPYRCPDAFYELMDTCWYIDPITRPTFEHLSEYLQDFKSYSEHQYMEME